MSTLTLSSISCPNILPPNIKNETSETLFTARYACESDFEFVQNSKLELMENEDITPSIDYEEEASLTRKAIHQNNIIIAQNEGVPVAFVWFTVTTQTPFGCGTYAPWGSRIVWISLTYVKKEWRRRGLGRFLYTQVEDYCKQEEIDEIQLDVYLTNKHSTAFHKEMGFKPYVQLFSKRISSTKPLRCKDLQN